jgi:hypothetical protein
MPINQPQLKKAFFDPTPDRCFPTLPARPTDDEVRMMLAENNAKCPLSKIVVSEKNRDAMHTLRLFAFTALTRSDHSMRGMNFGAYAMPGQGKTTVVKALLETVGIPTLFVQSDSLESTWHLFELIRDKLDECGCPLVPQTSNHHLIIPPMAVFFDEAHSLKQDLRTGGLLNAMEGDDGWLRTKAPGRNKPTYLVDCRDICWIAATTDPGLLFEQSEAFYSRFPTQVRWANAGKPEIASIVKSKFPKMPQEACDLVAHYCRVPRQAKAFAEKMDWQRRFAAGLDWKEAAFKVADLARIDKHGMPLQYLDVLTALGQKPISKANLCIAAKCNIDELSTMVLPYLLDDYMGTGPLIGITSKGCALTKAGMAELDLREIDHNGQSVLSEYL